MTRGFISFIKREIAKKKDISVTIQCQPVCSGKKKNGVQRFVGRDNSLGEHVSNLVAEKRSWEWHSCKTAC